MEAKQHGFILKSGKFIYAHDLRFGMNAELTLSYGYDGMYYPLENEGTDDECGIYTPEEAIEIADYMIDLWQKFKRANEK